jgi:hypothetical protein
MIPKKFLELLMKFLGDKKIGQVILHVHEGNILRIELNESVKL